MTWRRPWMWFCPSSWPWCRHAHDTSGDAQAALENLEAQTDEIRAVGAELREIALTNHFKNMVRGAISRPPPPQTHLD